MSTKVPGVDEDLNNLAKCKLTKSEDPSALKKKKGNRRPDPCPELSDEFRKGGDKR